MGYLIDRDPQNRDHSVEITYLGFNNWEGDDNLTARPALNGFTFALQPIPANELFTGFSNAQQFLSNYRSDLQSLEIDYRVRNRPGAINYKWGLTAFGRGMWCKAEQNRCSWVCVVFRRKNSTMSLPSIRTSPVLRANYRINTKNHLLGIQVGGDCYDVHEGWYWGLKGDVGLYCNFVNGFADVQGTDPSASPTPLSVRNNASDQTPAFFGELSFMVGYDINDHLMIHTGWDLAQLGGLALAPEQVSFTSKLLSDTPFTKNDGQVFLNGLSVGLDAYW